ncbi:MAG: hypothetical protein FJX74_05920 [Armatimonadetes bacterium]|nr:hypothetical protein [Armatimonadota bacterium]
MFAVGLALMAHIGCAQVAVEAGEPFGALPLVDEVVCGSPTDSHLLVEEPAGATAIETLLGQPCRVLKPSETPPYVAYRLGQGKGLKPGGAYLLALEYPEDRPRAMFVGNRGCETVLGFATGAAVGDALHGKYTTSNPESLRYPLSGRMETWQTLFYLHDRFPDLDQPRGEGPRPMLPADGFWVVISQPRAANDPLSAGAAVARLRLFEVPDPERVQLDLKLPPEPLPRRHVFHREEMSDGVVQSRDETQRGVADDIAWFEYKARLMRFWGFNTYCKDLLEFGHNQGWDSSPYGSHDWVNQSSTPDRWPRILERIGKYGFDVLPYYEYAGSVGQKSLGIQRRARPLTRDDAYTHISWSEIANADVTDPETLADAKKVLDCTILRNGRAARFLGAWFRQRPSHVPIGFGEADLLRFGWEANEGVAVTREQLKADPALLQRYYDWWFAHRHGFFVGLRDYLRRWNNPEAVVLFTADTSEAGFSLRSGGVVTDDPAAWQPLVGQPGQEKLKVRPYDEVVQGGEYLSGMLAPAFNWGDWEWHHSCPQPDPQRYRDTEGVMLTYSINRAYTVASPEALEAFRTPSGLAVVRHHNLNEHEMNEKLGYFVGDMERAGPYCMMAEARAVATGDPFYVGYLASNCFNRGFPQHVRRFCSAFLALPALPSTVVANAVADPEVVVRQIPTEGHGTYFAVVNTGLSPKPEVILDLPADGRLLDAATDAPLPREGGRLTLSLGPCELRALRAE